MKLTCNRCDKQFSGEPEICWYCRADLCVECWEAHGHCGHPEAEAVNEAHRKHLEEQEEAQDDDC